MNFGDSIGMYEIIFARLPLLPRVRGLGKIVSLDYLLSIGLVVILLNFIYKSNFLLFHLLPLIYLYTYIIYAKTYHVNMQIIYHV